MSEPCVKCGKPDEPGNHPGPRGLEHFYQPEPERITGVAFSWKGQLVSMSRGRHFWLIERMRDPYGMDLPRESTNVANQGFITNTGRFVDRKEAMKVARAARQLKRDVGKATGLVSEDVWLVLAAISLCGLAGG